MSQRPNVDFRGRDRQHEQVRADKVIIDFLLLLMLSECANFTLAKFD